MILYVCIADPWLHATGVEISPLVWRGGSLQALPPADGSDFKTDQSKYHETYDFHSTILLTSSFSPSASSSICSTWLPIALSTFL